MENGVSATAVHSKLEDPAFAEKVTLGAVPLSEVFDTRRIPLK